MEGGGRTSRTQEGDTGDGADEVLLKAHFSRNRAVRCLNKMNLRNRDRWCRGKKVSKRNDTELE